MDDKLQIRLLEKLRFSYADLNLTYNKDVIKNVFKRPNENFGDKEKRTFLEKVLKNRFTQPQYKYENNFSKNFIKENYDWLFKAQLANRIDGGLEGDYQWKRLMEIIEIYFYFQPSHVIEFGSGTSSYIFSKLVKNFITFEESSKWHSRLINNIPKFLNRKFILQSQLSERKLTDLNGECVTYYLDSMRKCKEFLKNKKMSLIYIDGPYSGPLPKDNLVGKPSEITKDKSNYNLANADTILLNDFNFQPDIIVVDGRRPTLKLITKTYNDYFKFFKSEYPLKRIFKFHFNPPLYHSIFIKKGILNDKTIKKLGIRNSEHI